MNAGHDVVARQIHFKRNNTPARLFKPQIEIVDPGKNRKGNQNNDGGDEATLEAQEILILSKVRNQDSGFKIHDS